MRRYISVGGVILLALLAGAVFVSLFNKPTEVEYRLARGRAQFYTENYLAALQTLRDISDSQKAGPQAHSYLGAAYLKLHLYKAAIKEFEEAIRQRPRQSDPWIGLASSYIELGDIQKAIDEAKRATEIERRSADAWIALGRAEWQQRNFDEAEKASLKAREIDPRNPAISDLLLHVYFDLDQPDKFQAELDRTGKPAKPAQDLAIRFFLRRGLFSRAYDAKVKYEREDLERSVLETQLALKREPSRIDLIPPLVKNLVKLSRFDEAINSAENYKRPGLLDLELGKAYWMLGRKDEAIRAYRRVSAALVHKLSAEVALAAITSDIKHWEAAYRAEHIEQDYFILARLEDLLSRPDPLVRAFIYRYAGIYDTSFYNKAAEEAVKVLNDNPKNFDALMTLSTAYQRLGRIGDARRYVELARDLYPQSAEPASRLASLSLLIEPNDPQQILGFMETAVKLEPKNAGYLYNLGWLYDQLGNAAKATDFYQRAIKASPLTFEAMNNLALIYSSAGEPDRALPLLEQAMRTDPENEAVYANAANYYVRQHAWKQALENYDRTVQINPANSIAAVEKGRIFLEEGETDSAIDSLSRALEVDPHSFDAYMVLSSAYEKMGRTKEAIAAVEEAQRIRPDAPEVQSTLDRLGALKKVGERSATSEDSKK
jgi:tetratricopeptide (TPR) repeat protein